MSVRFRIMLTAFLFIIGWSAAVAGPQNAAKMSLKNYPTSPPAAKKCAALDSLVWLDGNVAYSSSDARFAATQSGTFACRSTLAPSVTIASPVPSTPLPTIESLIGPVVSAGGGLGNPKTLACTCVEVPIYYVTDRASSAGSPWPKYGSEQKADGLTYGTSIVTIPRDHRMGDVEQPQWYLFQFSENPNQNVTIKIVKETTPTSFFGQISGDAANTSGDALVFIHGYNVAFEDSLERMAQIKYDLGFAGPAIAYSWPSAGQLIDYAHDGKEAALTTPRFLAFLETLAKTSGVARVHVLAHSMGNRILTSALEQEASLPNRASNIGTVIFAAPDVARSDFITSFAKFHGLATTATLYASSSDKALKVSELLNGGPRAGDAANIITLAGLQSIDATAVDTSFDGHGYFAGNDTVMSDIFYLLRGLPMPRFRLRGVPLNSPQFWRIAP